MIKLQATVTCDHLGGPFKADPCPNETLITLVVGEAEALTEDGHEKVAILEIKDVHEDWYVLWAGGRHLCPEHNR
jgi:hypothetical protein